MKLVEAELGLHQYDLCKENRVSNSGENTLREYVKRCSRHSFSEGKHHLFLRKWAGNSIFCSYSAAALDIIVANGQQSAVMHQPFNQGNPA